jgi:uncharacterized protein YodC (DUF2158 family)
MAEEANGFAVGDVVILKSGSPKMSVYSLRDKGHIECKWFAGLKSERDVFHSSNLIYAPEEPKK